MTSAEREQAIDHLLNELRKRVIARSQIREDDSLTDLATTFADVAADFMPHTSLGAFLARQIDAIERKKGSHKSTD